MKFRLKQFLFVAVSALVLFSCNKDAENPFYNNDYGIFSADINGFQWSASSGYADQITNNTLELYGSQGNSFISITIYPYNGPNTYNLNATNKGIYTDSAYQYNAINGTVTIANETNEYVEGNFNFTAVQNGGSATLNINNGTFKLYKQ